MCIFLWPVSTDRYTFLYGTGNVDLIGFGLSGDQFPQTTCKIGLISGRPIPAISVDMFPQIELINFHKESDSFLQLDDIITYQLITKGAEWYEEKWC